MALTDGQTSASLDSCEWDYFEELEKRGRHQLPVEQRAAWCAWELARQVRVKDGAVLETAFLPESVGPEFKQLFRSQSLCWQLVTKFAQASSDPQHQKVGGRAYPRPWLKLSKPDRLWLVSNTVSTPWTIHRLKTQESAAVFLGSVQADIKRRESNAPSDREPHRDITFIELHTNVGGGLTLPDYERLIAELRGKSKHPQQNIPYDSLLRSLAKLRLILSFGRNALSQKDSAKYISRHSNWRDQWQRPCRQLLDTLQALFPQHVEPPEWRKALR